MPDPVVETQPVIEAPPVVEVPPVVTDAPPETNWLLQMPEELQNDPSLNTFKDVETLARSFVETKRMVGDRVKLPDENTPLEEVNKFYAKLGVPEKPEEYVSAKIESFPALGIDQNLIDNFRPVFHKYKLTRAQAEGIQTEYLRTISEQQTQLVQAYQAQVNQQMETLKNRWGDEFDAKRDLAMRTFAAHASPSLKATVEKEGWGNHPDFVELFHDLGVATSEDTLRGGSPLQATSIDAQIKELELKLYNMPVTDPEYKGLIQKRKELYEQRYPQPE